MYLLYDWYPVWLWSVCIVKVVINGGEFLGIRVVLVLVVHTENWYWYIHTYDRYSSVCTTWSHASLLPNKRVLSSLPPTLIITPNLGSTIAIRLQVLLASQQHLLLQNLAYSKVAD
jgi:hypothetical protein